MRLMRWLVAVWVLHLICVGPLWQFYLLELLVAALLGFSIGHWALPPQ